MEPQRHDATANEEWNKEKQQICDRTVDLTEQEMTATDDSRENLIKWKLDVSFVLLLETQDGEVPVIVSLDNMKLQNLDDE